MGLGHIQTLRSPQGDAHTHTHNYTHTHTHHRRNTPGDLHLETITSSDAQHSLRDTITLRLQCSQTNLRPQVCAATPTQTPPPVHSFPDRHPPTWATTVLHNSRRHHSYRLFSEWCPLELCSTQSAQLYMEALLPLLQPCKHMHVCAHTRVEIHTDSHLDQLTLGNIHTPLAQPRTLTIWYNCLHTHSSSIETHLHTTRDIPSWNIPSHPALCCKRVANKLTATQTHSRTCTCRLYKHWMTPSRGMVAYIKCTTRHVYPRALGFPTPGEVRIC